jgi:sulfur-carrier protein
MIEVRVELPAHLRTLARVDGEVRLTVPATPTIADVVDALETAYPMLRGTIRDHATRRRRAHMRYFGAGEDISHLSPDTRLPEEVTTGRDVFRVLGAISGG